MRRSGIALVLFLLAGGLAHASTGTGAAQIRYLNGVNHTGTAPLADFTVKARMIYDNTRNVDVVATLQDIMGWYHNYRFSGIDPLGASPSAGGPVAPTPVTYDCPSAHYGGSGQLVPLSALVAAMKGNKPIGEPAWEFPVGLPCGALPSGGSDVPVGRRLFPGYIDIHTQKTFTPSADMAGWSQNFHNRMYEFISYNNLGGKRVIFGETNPIEPGCNNGWTKEQAEAMLYGIPGSGSGFVNSQLFLYYAGNVVMRPWQDITYAHSACMGFPNTINPPFNPMP